MLSWLQRCRERKQLRHKYTFLSAYFASDKSFSATDAGTNHLHVIHTGGTFWLCNAKGKMLKFHQKVLALARCFSNTDGTCHKRKKLHPITSKSEKFVIPSCKNPHANRQCCGRHLLNLISILCRGLVWAVGSTKTTVNAAQHSRDLHIPVALSPTYGSRAQENYCKGSSSRQLCRFASGSEIPKQ